MTLCSAACRVSIKTVKASYDKHDLTPDLHTVHFIAIYFQIGEQKSSCTYTVGAWQDTQIKLQWPESSMESACPSDLPQF